MTNFRNLTFTICLSALSILSYAQKSHAETFVFTEQLLSNPRNPDSTRGDLRLVFTTDERFDDFTTYIQTNATINPPYTPPTYDPTKSPGLEMDETLTYTTFAGGHITSWHLNWKNYTSPTMSPTNIPDFTITSSTAPLGGTTPSLIVQLKPHSSPVKQQKLGSITLDLIAATSKHYRLDVNSQPIFTPNFPYRYAGFQTELRFSDLTSVYSTGFFNTTRLDDANPIFNYGVPEPLSTFGALTTLGLGVTLKRKLAKKILKFRSF